MRQNTTSLTQRTLSAFGWRFASVFSKFVLQVTVGVILARLLPVEAFGLLGLAIIITGFAAVLSEMGIASALVQRTGLTEAHIRVGFTLSVLWGLILTIVIWFGAPITRWIFNTDNVVPIVRLLSLSFLFTSLGTTAGALIQRRLDFRRLFWTEIVSYIFGYALFGIILSVLGFGVWSLAWALLLQTVLKTFLLLVFSPHPLRPSLALTEARQLLHFGIGISLARISNYAARNGDYFVVARYLGTLALGFYSRAYQLMTVPIAEFSSAISTVLFPAYAQIQNEPERLKRAYLGAISLVAITVFPLLTGMAIVAPEIIRGVLGPKWTGATRAFQILCIGGFCRSMYNLGDALARAKGAVYAQFWRHSIYAIAIFVGAIIGRSAGIEGVAVGVVFALIIMYFLMAHLSLKLINDNWKKFFKTQIPGLILAAIVAGVSFPTTLVLRSIKLPDLAILSITVATCIIALVIVVLTFPGRWFGKTSLWIISQIKGKWGRKFHLLRDFTFWKT